MGARWCAETISGIGKGWLSMSCALMMFFVILFGVSVVLNWVLEGIEMIGKGVEYPSDVIIYWSLVGEGSRI